MVGSCLRLRDLEGLGREIISGKDVTIGEFFNGVYFVLTNLSRELTNKPLEILLENTFTSAAEILAKCIQTRFCGVGLPTTVEDCHGGVINLSNFVAVKTNNRDTSFGVKVNRSVSRLPVLVLLDCLTHLGFDLTHDQDLRVFVVGWGAVPSTPIRYTILGVCAVSVDTLTNWHTISLHLHCEEIVLSTAHNFWSLASWRSETKLIAESPMFAPTITTMAARKIRILEKFDVNFFPVWILLHGIVFQSGVMCFPSFVCFRTCGHCSQE